MAPQNAMSGADAAWLRMDRSTNLMVINAVMWFAEPIAISDIRDVLEERLVGRFRRFRQRAADSRLPGQGPHWEDDPTFDLDAHLHRRALPAPGGQAELEQLVGDLASTPLDRSRPLWQMYLIEGYGSGCALLARMHHSIADGIALARSAGRRHARRRRRGARARRAGRETFEVGRPARAATVG